MKNLESAGIPFDILNLQNVEDDKKSTFQETEEKAVEKVIEKAVIKAIELFAEAHGIPLSEILESVDLDELDVLDELDEIIDADAPLGDFLDDEISEEEIVGKIDDNGQRYTDGENLLPNVEYTLNGITYNTDDKCRIISANGEISLNPETERDMYAQQHVGGKDRLDTDDGGHIIAREFGGDSGEGNMIALDRGINRSDYKRMENEIKSALDDGKQVKMSVDIHYNEDSLRPDKITNTVEIDGKKTVYEFDNDLDGKLNNEIPDNVQEKDKDKLDLAKGKMESQDGVVSSIKKEYNEEGVLENTTYTITYSDAANVNQRMKIDISEIEGYNTASLTSHKFTPDSNIISSGGKIFIENPIETKNIQVSFEQNDRINA